MNVPAAKDPNRPLCPKCDLPTDRHCPSPTCDWRKCSVRACGITIGRRVMDRDGSTVP